jgi:hypothetical protein
MEPPPDHDCGAAERARAVQVYDVVQLNPGSCPWGPLLAIVVAIVDDERIEVIDHRATQARAPGWPVLLDTRRASRCDAIVINFTRRKREARLRLQHT